MILFNKAPVVGTEIEYIEDSISSRKFCGDGKYTKLCQQYIQDKFGAKKVLLTPSCTASLEMAAILINIEDGDEVIMPSFTFVSTANAFVLRGAKIVFIDVEKDSMNMDVSKVLAAITSKTKAIVPVHYAGQICDMDTIMAIAKENKLWVIEDAAQAVMSTYKERYAGTIGHIGCYSFHETKNYTSGGEGGAIIINDEHLIKRAEIIREKGTDRSQFIQGIVDKYTWKDIGSSYLMSDIQAAYLYPQLISSDFINEFRLSVWHTYYISLLDLSIKYKFSLPKLFEDRNHNAHMFFIKLSSFDERAKFIDFMKQSEITTPFHYLPLHSCEAGIKFGRFNDVDEYTTSESQKLVRLPLYYGITKEEVNTIILRVEAFFSQSI
ncbi:dTDP-4-amino-4,6-dideoxygalactose transaminase [Aeromonas veronii]|uniref:dTDP-4-amino-4,6-dideoxygalactose transaminase n=1 Tax=Aeromonas veronii TaxID=654 RepID=UPI00366C067D